MAQSILIFPQTVLSRAALACLVPWLHPAALLEPPSLGSPAPDEGSAISPALEDQGLLGRISLPAEECQGLAAQVSQWRQWVYEHENSGMVEAVKAGIKPPPPPKTWRNVMNDIRDFGKPGDDAPELPPLARAGLLLHLSHQRDLAANEMDSIMAQVDVGQDQLEKSLGLEEADAPAVDYQKAFGEIMSPVDYSLPEDQNLQQRLSAWAQCAAGLVPRGACLATTSLEAAKLLMERANQGLAFEPGGFRSPAGAVMPQDDYKNDPSPDSPLAQEAARLVLPDLSRLSDEELISLKTPFTEVRRGLTGIIEALSRGAWSADLQSRLSQEAKELAEKAAAAVADAGIQAGPEKGLSILAFPGLSLDGVMDLMKGEGAENRPAKEDWPDNWPQGSCPLVVIW